MLNINDEAKTMTSNIWDELEEASAAPELAGTFEEECQTSDTEEVFDELEESEETPEEALTYEPIEDAAGTDVAYTLDEKIDALYEHLCNMDLHLQSALSTIFSFMREHVAATPKAAAAKAPPAPKAKVVKKTAKAKSKQGTPGRPAKVKPKTQLPKKKAKASPKPPKSPNKTKVKARRR
jgi:hypothetical protein